MPSGSGMPQSLTSLRPMAGQAFESTAQPMVITTSARSTISSVSNFGASADEDERPQQLHEWTAEGLRPSHQPTRGGGCSPP